MKLELTEEERAALYYAANQAKQRLEGIRDEDPWRQRTVRKIGDVLVKLRTESRASSATVQRVIRESRQARAA